MPYDSSEKKKIVFFSFVGSNYSRSSVILNFESRRFQKEFFYLPTGVLNFSKLIFSKRHEIRKADYLVVMSPCHIVTPFLRVLTKRSVILDAGWSLTDGQISRGLKTQSRIKSIRIYLLDFIAFHSADRLCLESEIQAFRTSRIFLVPRRKIKVIFTSLDETLFHANTLKSKKIKVLHEKIKKRNSGLIVLFRGKVNSESGIEHILEAAEILKDKASFILVCGANDVFPALPANTILLSKLSDLELSEVYQISDVTLGQLSNHPRLRYTIPHKAFEAGFFAKPYITANSAGVRELYGSESVVLIDEVTGNSLALEILKLKERRARLQLGTSIHASYQEKAAQKVINSRFEAFLEELQ
jgi:hypothetical protein